MVSCDMQKKNSFFRHLVFVLPQLHPLQTQMESQQQYLPRDFIPKIDTKPKQKDIQCTHVHAWRHRYSMTMPNVIVADATKEEKQTVLEDMIHFKEKLSSVIRNKLKHILVTYAPEVLKYKCGDGQPVATWREVKSTSLVEYTKGRVESSFDLLYKSFPTSWEKLQEDIVLDEMKILYRPWTSDNNAPKGFVAKFFSSLLSCKRKEIGYVKRRTEAHLDEDVNKLRRRNKHIIKYDAFKHAKCVGELAAESTNKLSRSAKRYCVP